jgi:hypothetical protein
MRPCCPRSMLRGLRCIFTSVEKDRVNVCFCRFRPHWFDHPFWVNVRSLSGDQGLGILIHPYSFDDRDESELAEVCKKHGLHYLKNFEVNLWNEDALPVLISRFADGGHVLVGDHFDDRHSE